MLVTNQFPTPAEPERGVFTLQIAKRLATLCELTVVCPLPWFPALPALRRFPQWYRFAEVPYQWAQDGIRVIAPKYPMLPKLSERFHAKIMGMALRRVIDRLVRTEGVDVINSHWLYPDSVAVHYATTTSRVPHVPTGLGCDINEFLDDKHKGPQLLRLLDACQSIIVVSEGLKEHLVTRGIAASSITTIPNGVDTTQFRVQNQDAVRKELGLSNDVKYILYVGRLSEEKCVDVLLAAFAQVSRTAHDTVLLLIGDGPLRTTLVQQAQTLNISDRVRFVGHLEHRQVPDWMAAADCFCLPSKREGCPNVVLESLACGLPVVASNVGGIPDMVDASTGILVPPEAPSDLANALTRALSEQWDRSAIATTVVSQSWDGTARSYWRLFQRLLPPDSPGLGGRQR